MGKPLFPDGFQEVAAFAVSRLRPGEVRQHADYGLWWSTRCKTQRLCGALLRPGARKMPIKDALQTGVRLEKSSTAIPVLITPKEAATLLKVSSSWLAKARMRGDGPPYICVGRSIRYAETALIHWMKSRQRLSTSEQ